MTAPLVAIVTPTHNGARFLAETMESVQKQIWRSVVHIVLDNNSTDGTAEIIANYSNKRVPVVSYYNHETLGQRDNWNRAYSHVPAEAAYVRYLCDDDTITPDSVAKMAALAENNPGVGAVGCLHHCAGAVQDFFWPKDRTVFNGTEAIRMTLLRQGVLMPVQMMWRKSVADQLHPLFEDAVDSGWDLDAVLKMLTRSDFGFVHENLGFTRVHANTMTSLTSASKTRAWTRDALHLMTRYGPLAFGPEYSAQLLRFRRYYVRRIIAWWKQDHGRENLGIHLDALDKAGWKFSAPLALDALADWACVKIGMRRNWSGYPGWQ
ncbi:glycosyltransferase involved in cell wall biosynthesis [Rhizobium sp. BK313]|uniref:glycosyltransferase family 2 protein n=1 Tax=Rhizobium sp. BK313 TaxID=2587081 RepID=UPI0010DCA065|nr:glycosyltransferase family 2 protein [Rhizobium sp. BK313]MBB3457446.1 glycosyltransferase involved in cell wall biosynthesis [Rhizobium sp. BK313]